MCPLCHFSLKTEEHLFLNFPDTRRVWFAPPLAFHIPNKIYIHVWMLKWFQCRDQSWANLVCATLWRIWHGRNQQMFQQKEFKLVEIARGMYRLVEEVSWDKIIYQGGCETSGEAINGTIVEAECCAFIDVICFPGAWITWGCVKNIEKVTPPLSYQETTNIFVSIFGWGDMGVMVLGDGKGLELVRHLN